MKSIIFDAIARILGRIDLNVSLEKVVRSYPDYVWSVPLLC